MCKVNKDGYVLKSGKTVRYDTNISNLDVKDINDLNNEPGTKWDVFIIHKEVKDISSKLDEKFEKIIEAIESSKIGHIKECPLNALGINELVEKKMIELANDGLGSLLLERVDKHLKSKNIRVYRGIKGIIRDFLLITSAAAALFAILKLFGSS